MKTPVTVFAVATTMVLSLTACHGYKSKKNSSANAPAKEETKPVEKGPIDSACPQNAEGEWKIHTAIMPTGIFAKLQSTQVRYEKFTISRNEAGILQMNKAGVAEPIVFDAQTRILPLTYSKYTKSVSKEGASYAAKCADGVIYITEKRVVNKLGDEVVSNFEFTLYPNDIEGLLKSTVGGQTSIQKVTKSLEQQPQPKQTEEEAVPEF